MNIYSGFTSNYLIAHLILIFRLFDMLENAIITLNYSAASNETPFNFSAQFQFIDECTKERLIESYYDLDGLLCREIVGKKLSSRLRKDLDEICEKISTTDKSVVACGAGAVGLRLKSARRQFDNVKRVFKTIEEMGGDYVTNIKNQVIFPNTSNDHRISIIFLRDNMPNQFHSVILVRTISDPGRKICNLGLCIKFSF